jgi:hypothetical protein
MIPPCPVVPGALVRTPGEYLGRVVEIHPLTRQVTVKLGDETERFGWGEIHPAMTARRWPPRPHRLPHTALPVVPFPLCTVTIAPLLLSRWLRRGRESRTG